MPRTTRARPRQARSQQMVDRILAAATQVLDEHGYAAMSTNRVAERAGVSVGSLYRYFEDRSDLMEHLRERATAATMADLTAAMTDAMRLGTRGGVRHVVATLVRSLEQNAAIVRALIDEVPLGSHQNALPQLETQLGHFARMFAGQQMPQLSQHDLDTRVYLALGVTLNACLRIALERPPELDAEELVDLVTGLLVAGLTLPPTATPPPAA